jgi:hypothetical protein
VLVNYAPKPEADWKRAYQNDLVMSFNIRHDFFDRVKVPVRRRRSR